MDTVRLCIYEYVRSFFKAFCLYMSLGLFVVSVLYFFFILSFGGVRWLAFFLSQAKFLILFLVDLCAGTITMNKRHRQTHKRQ